MKPLKVKYFLFILLVNSAIFFSVAKGFQFTFEDNDDITMAWLANGIYTGQPDCHLEYINAVYGSLLTSLYSAFSGVEWYSLLFAAFQILSISIIMCYAIDSFKDRKYLAIICVAFIYCFWFWIIARFQFTTVAAILAFSSTLLLLDRRFVSGGLLFIIASLIRFSSAGLVGLLMAPAFVYCYRFELKKCWLPLSLILALVYGFHKCDDCYYQDAGWKYYREFDSARGKINDNPNEWRVRGHLPEGMKTINYDMLSVFFVDPGVVSATDMEEIVGYLFSAVPLKKLCRNAVYNCVLRYWKWFLALFILCSFLALHFFPKSKSLSLLLIVACCMWLAVLCFVAFNGSVKNRVFTSSMMAMLFYPFFALSLVEKDTERWRILCPAVLLLAIGVLWYAVPAFQRSSALNGKRVLFAEQVELVNSLPPEMSVVTNGPDFIVEMARPFELSSTIRPRVFLNPYCMMGSPANNDRLAKHSDLIKGTNCMLVQRGRDGFDLLLKSMEINYGLKIDTVHIKESPNCIIVGFEERQESLEDGGAAVE